MSESSNGPGWWIASDGKWYPPEQRPAPSAPTPPQSDLRPAAPPDSEPSAPSGTPAVPTIDLRKFLLIGGVGLLVILVLYGAGTVILSSRGKLDTNAIPLGVDEAPSNDLVLADGAVVVRSDGGKAVRELAPDGTRVVLAADAPGADQLAPGKALILTGVTAAKVATVEKDGDRIVVTTTPAAITDLIKDGNLSWDDQAVDLSKATLRVFAPTPDLVTENGAAPLGGGSGDQRLFDDQVVESGDPGVGRTLTAGEARTLFTGAGADGQSAGFVDLPLAGGVGEQAQGGGQSISRSGELGGFHYTFDARVSGDTINFTLELTKEQNGFVIDIGVQAEVSGVGFDGNLEISAATVRNFRMDADNLRGKAKVTGGVAAGPQATRVPVTVLHLPMSVQIPFPIYGIPFTVGIEADAKIEVMFTSRDAAVRGEFDAHFDGRGSMTFSNGSLTTSGAFNVDWEDPLRAVEGVSIAPASLLITIQFPKVSLGIGIALARASAYIEATYSFAPTISGVTNVTPCRAEPVSMSVKAGYTAELFGHEVAGSEQVITQRSAAPFDPPVRVCEI